MKSALPKVLHNLCGRPMIGWVLDQARSLDPERILLVLGHGAEQVRAEYLVGYYPRSTDEERTPHQVEIRVAESVKGDLYGGSRSVVGAGGMARRFWVQASSRLATRRR